MDSNIKLTDLNGHPISKGDVVVTGVFGGNLRRCVIYDIVSEQVARGRWKPETRSYEPATRHVLKLKSAFPSKRFKKKPDGGYEYVDAIGLSYPWRSSIENQFKDIIFLTDNWIDGFPELAVGKKNDLPFFELKQYV